MPLQPSTATSRDDAASLNSASSSRKGIERERDISLNGSESSSTRNRRPSSVFEHVGGMWDRFGKRLQSRGEPDRRRLSSSMLGLNGSAVDVVDSGSSVDDHVSAALLLLSEDHGGGNEKKRKDLGQTSLGWFFSGSKARAESSSLPRQATHRKLVVDR